MIFSYPEDNHQKRRINLKDINNLSKKDPQKLISITTNYYNRQVEKTVEGIISDNSKVVLLAGPSGSGKTTTAGNIAKLLNQKGKIAHVVSIDNFFVGKGNYPILPDGSEDFESVYSLDLNLFRKTVDDILTKDEVSLPKFDFSVSQRTDNAYTLKLTSQDIIIFEGIHALNPLLLPENHKSEIFRVYVAVKSEIYDNENKVLSSQNIRLIRRMIRDNLFRNYPHQRTVRIWNNVLNGEEKYIKPFMREADSVIDSIHPYEIGVYRAILLKTPPLETFENETKRISEIAQEIEKFTPFDETKIPKDSMIREFIGE